MLCHAAKFEKKLHNNIDLHNFGLKLGQNCLFGPKEKFLMNFTQIYLLCPIMLHSLKKNLPVI